MVVLSACVTCDGKLLVARQFVDMASSRVEGLIASLPALRHNATYVETDQVRMVYQPLDTLLLVLITTTSSNILLDLHSLDLVKQLLNELGATTKQTINLHKFELLGLLDELITNGYQNNVTLAQLRSISLMESHDERIQAELDKKKELYAKEETKKKAKQLDLLKRDARRQQQQQQPQYPSQPQYQPQQPVQQPFQTQYQPPVSAEPATASRGMKLGSKSKQDTVLDSLRHDHAIRDMPARTHAPVANPVHQEPLAPIDPYILIDNSGSMFKLPKHCRPPLIATDQFQAWNSLAQ